MDINAGHTDGDMATIAHIPPPGEEECEMNHEGGEYKVFEGLIEDIAQATGLYVITLCVPISLTYSHASSHHIDSCPCMDHVEIQTDNWKMQLDRLVNTYLLYWQLNCGDGLPKAPDPPEDSTLLPLFMIEVLDCYCSYSILSFSL